MQVTKCCLHHDCCCQASQNFSSKILHTTLSQAKNSMGQKAQCSMDGDARQEDSQRVQDVSHVWSKTQGQPKLHWWWGKTPSQRAWPPAWCWHFACSVLVTWTSARLAACPETQSVVIMSFCKSRSVSVSATQDVWWDRRPCSSSSQRVSSEHP